MLCVGFYKQKTAYEMRISDWSSDVCSSDLLLRDALPMSYTLLPLTTPIRFVVATAELELNESATLVVAVLLLSAAALPSPRATATPRLSRLLPLLSSL